MISILYDFTTSFQYILNLRFRIAELSKNECNIFIFSIKTSVMTDYPKSDSHYQFRIWKLHKKALIARTQCELFRQ